ncbi:hypothetical protein [Propionivibrio dicarboxylicus]|uniref:hypothetical protein n=1 Tax=Propionivibrio dicarboxylicus TaxID=83767 RepID=UPI00115FB44F|nr:hypothetical protein [Propionivibrio dicarboxylicus]
MSISFLFLALLVSPYTTFMGPVRQQSAVLAAKCNAIGECHESPIGDAAESALEVALVSAGAPQRFFLQEKTWLINIRWRI